MTLLIDSCVFIDAFDPSSDNYEVSLGLLNELKRKHVLITMPAHAWFEVQCTLQNMITQGRFSGAEIQGAMNYPLKLIHIDDHFIEKYKMIDIPYIKAGDHIFVVVAKVNDHPLVTNDKKMHKVASSCGVRVFFAKDYLREINQ